MKLEPIAKPIRIRIKIGKEEFSDFNSLKENLSLKELYPLFKDGRLERWFNQIGKDELARKTGEAAKMFEEENISDYLLLLSLFSDEVSSIMAQTEKDFNIIEFCKEASLQNIEMIYGYTKDIKVFEWGKIAEGIISPKNFKDFFEDKYLHDICSNAEWGKRFANFVKNGKEYEEWLDYLEEKSREKQEGEDLIQTFYDTACSNGFELAKMSKAKLTLEYLGHVYQNSHFKKLHIEWGKIFADSLKDWENEGYVYNILKDNSQHIISFYEHCAENGIHEAKAKLDPWYVLANSDDFENIDRALAEWDGYYLHYNKKNYGYFKIKNELGKQILIFLQSLISLRGKDGQWTDWNKYDHYHLANEKEIMLIVKHRYYNCYLQSKTFTKTYSGKLKALEDKNELAKYALNHEKDSYLDIALEAVKIIRRRLLEKRETR